MRVFVERDLPGDDSSSFRQGMPTVPDSMAGSAAEVPTPANRSARLTLTFFHVSPRSLLSRSLSLCLVAGPIFGHPLTHTHKRTLTSAATAWRRAEGVAGSAGGGVLGATVAR